MGRIVNTGYYYEADFLAKRIFAGLASIALIVVGAIALAMYMNVNASLTAARAVAIGAGVLGLFSVCVYLRPLLHATMLLMTAVCIWELVNILVFHFAYNYSVHSLSLDIALCAIAFAGSIFMNDLLYDFFFVRTPLPSTYTPAARPSTTIINNTTTPAVVAAPMYATGPAYVSNGPAYATVV